MRLSSHIKQSFVLFPGVYYFWNLKTAIIFIASFIFIDLDHYFLSVCKSKDFSIKRMFDYFDEVWEDRHNRYEICVFHTIEFFIVLYVLGYWRMEFWIILAGFSAHFLLDLYHLYKHKAVSIRAHSLIEYFVRKRMIKKNRCINR